MRPRRARAAPTKTNKVQSIRETHALIEDLPENLDAERFILGSILRDGSRFCELGALTPSDFSLERHRLFFLRMGDLCARGEHIEVITLGEELVRHSELGRDGVSYLASLVNGLPHIPQLGSYVRIVREKSALRRTILALCVTTKECLSETAAPSEILDRHLADIEKLRAGCCADRGQIGRVEDLECIFTNRAPLEYLVKPEVPVKTVVCLTGDSESGKTTLACAWARNLSRQGHAILILDRDKNPRDRICERLERLRMSAGGELFHVWDSEQHEEAPQPDDGRITDWVKRMVAQTEKSPLVILDSLVSFFLEDEDENAAADMRALFNRCRAITRLGGTVIVIHHPNRNGDPRGSSDFKPAGDQGFLVKNCDRDGGRLLDLITLNCDKSRYGFSGSIRYHYADGKMLRLEDGLPDKMVSHRLTELLKANPGILSGRFTELADKHRLGRNRGRDFLKDGLKSGAIRVEKEGRKHHHFWAGAQRQGDGSEP
jgi:AAA domain/DnaB-like helicase N terminal domain